MEYLYERVAYLRGLCDGMDISSDSKEGRLLMEIINVLGEFSDAMVDLEEEQLELGEYVESIDEDLSDLEADFYDLDEEDWDYYDEDRYYDDEDRELCEEDWDDEGVHVCSCGKNHTEEDGDLEG